MYLLNPYFGLSEKYFASEYAKTRKNNFSSVDHVYVKKILQNHSFSCEIPQNQTRIEFVSLKKVTLIATSAKVLLKPLAHC